MKYVEYLIQKIGVEGRLGTYHDQGLCLFVDGIGDSKLVKVEEDFVILHENGMNYHKEIVCPISKFFLVFEKKKETWNK